MIHDPILQSTIPPISYDLTWNPHFDNLDHKYIYIKKKINDSKLYTIIPKSEKVLGERSESVRQRSK